MILRLNRGYEKFENILLEYIRFFSTKGQDFVIGQRNQIKLFDLEDKKINIKSFKVPHFINKIAYKYFRKSKAKRSFEFANRLLELGVGTPKPIAFAEFSSILGLEKSFYVSEQLECELTYRELVEDSNYPDHENILRQFTKFSFDLHEKGIEFLDHSPGNTLIKKRENGNYEFFLVDLNRMEFHKSMSFDMRMKNLCRLTPLKEMVAVMSNEYAKLYGESEQKIFDTLWKYTSEFQERYYRKKRLKKKLKFWKK
ncbi:lipopolysaccharide kinase InaA family protein [Flavobacterium quisquiliarum]|uniref:Lipopolysaccharide kinase InaA family protein n=1 Tax=Flavobacterium quisquiliarum TaxID=1834436 RepID=A0ABV8W9G2_9FLAO|nr:lipopolysaccharide kinase InaA family protein [Flavobacterium quisquiliarum]MBW1656280.1 Kdo domain containing protein [Flavobacterium quisquiliarum]NWL02123.1 Kdo domain containing protein [Flavobacterium collinsii]